MPELPEVETVRTGLTPAMVGFKITKVDVNRPDLRWPLPKNMAARLAGTTVLNLRRRSKYILADLSSEETLLIHLGMSGRIQVSGSDLGQFHRAHPPRDKHDHVVFYMDNEARVAFNDPRRFGAMDLAQTRCSDRISRPRIAGLVPHIKDVLSEAIQAGGSSLRDHRQADGELGYFQHSFAVYDQEGSLCTTKGCHSAIQRIVQSGRSSFYCPTCQK